MSVRKRNPRRKKVTSKKFRSSKWSRMTDEEKKLENSLSFTTKNKSSFWKDSPSSPVRTLDKAEIAALEKSIPGEKICQ